MKNCKRFLAMLLAMFLIISLAACSDSTSQDAGEPADTGDGEAVAEESDSAGDSPESEPTPAPSGDTIKIGYSFPTKNNEFWGKSLTFLEFAADELNVELIATDCDNKQEKQVNDVDNMIAAGIQGLVLCPQDASVCPGIVQKCNERGIPVVIADRWPGDDLVAGTDYVAFIGPNDEQAGYDIAMNLINAGCTKIVAIGGFAGTSVAEGRRAGLQKAIDESDGVELLQYEAAGENMDVGDTTMRNFLQANPDLDGVWCYNDSLALASVNVLKERDMLADVKVGGMDLQDAAVESIEAGELYFSTGGHYMQSGFAMIMVYDAINGNMPTETVVRLNLLQVGPDTVARYNEKYVQNAAPLDIISMSLTHTPGATTYFELNLD